MTKPIDMNDIECIRAEITDLQASINDQQQSLLDLASLVGKLAQAVVMSEPSKQPTVGWSPWASKGGEP